MLRAASLAVVGGGAAGFYAAGRILSRSSQARVDIFERLPTPYGLVRFGVAPDHPEVKNCTAKFAQVAADPRVRYFGNVEVGSSSSGGPAARLPLEAVRASYDGVVLAYGAARDRHLGIPGEQGADGHKGVVSARQFVAWYNGLPEAQDLAPDLTSFDRVVVIGHGNVALDCARILLTPPDSLAGTDITEQALAALRRSRIRHVEMAGRRGPLQVAFTTKELREMTKLPGLRILCDRELLTKECEAPAGKEHIAASRPLKRTLDLLLKHAEPLGAATQTDDKTLTLSFLRSPAEVLYNQVRDGRSVPQLVRFRINQLTGAPGAARAVPTEAMAESACGMVLRSIGYASVPLVGAPFDSARSIVPNIAGRVVDADGNAVPGLYVAGWAKRGPVGVIATTMQDAYRTADAVLMDIDNGHIAAAGAAPRDAIDRMLAAENVAAARVSTSDWKRLDAFEAAAGAATGKPREKVTDVAAMLSIIRSGNAN
ncbi:NADPH-adrenodoxin reductase [Coemansia spiralis]|nr:NADPH-adrenodoxin reductase [Coemansia spiralis]